MVLDDVSIGSVALRHRDALQPWPQWIDFSGETCRLNLPIVERDAAFAQVHDALRRQGLIPAWRNETYAIVTHLGAPALALIERAASRFWGTLTFGAHCNGYVADAAGRPAHLWIARRALSKPTDPGKLDNLVGGGVPHGQTPFEALLREGFEEAGLDEATMQRATPGRVIELRCDIAEGFMHERLHTFDLCLPSATVPCNQDGEVAEWMRLSVDEAIERAGRDEMTVDAALVTLDFALRQRLLGTADAAKLAPRLAPLLQDTSP